MTSRSQCRSHLQVGFNRPLIWTCVELFVKQTGGHALSETTAVKSCQPNADLAGEIVSRPELTLIGFFIYKSVYHCRCRGDFLGHVYCKRTVQQACIPACCLITSYLSQGVYLILAVHNPNSCFLRGMVKYTLCWPHLLKRWSKCGAYPYLKEIHYPNVAWRNLLGHGEKPQPVTSLNYTMSPPPGMLAHTFEGLN